MTTDEDQFEIVREAGSTAPLLSVFVSAWNREDTIGRCFDSIFGQSFDDYEVVAVDDASMDQTLEIMKSYDDPHLRIVRHTRNLGKNPARSTAIRHCRGRWLLKLDSDDALLPNCLATFAELAQNVDDTVGIVGLSYNYDDGTTGPVPSFPEEDVGLTGWLQWVDTAKRVDFLTCFRREVLDMFPMPSDGRGSVQMMLRIASRWRIRVLPQPGGVVYTDAANRLSINKKTLLPPDAKIAMGDEANETLQEFGAQLRDHAPRMYRKVCYRAGWWYLLAGRRFRGGWNMLRYILRWPSEVKAWPWLLLGLIGPGALRWVLTRRSSS